MKYKAFEEFYREAKIKHLMLIEFDGYLVSPPFCTDKCKDYSNVMIIKEGEVSYIKVDTSPATSKYSGYAIIGDSLWFIPYGIWDDFNVVLQLKKVPGGLEPIHHTINKPGKGQFYNMDTDSKTAFSFPLGYEGTNFCLYIKDDQVHTIDFEQQPYLKLHMGTVYCNGRYWSPPRSEGGTGPGYINMMSFDGETITNYPINVKRPEVTRKYSDMVVQGNTLWALPFGEQPGLTEVLEFDTTTNTYQLHELNVPDFAKKYNCMVVVGDYIIGLPYGTKDENGSNIGVRFNMLDKTSVPFSIGPEYTFGGKYRFRSGLNYNGRAVFFPSGTPTCPIMSVGEALDIGTKYIEGVLFGRPIMFNGKIVALGYKLTDHSLSMYTFEEDLTYTTFFITDYA